MDSEVEDCDGFSGSAAEYAQPYIKALERDVSKPASRGNIDLPIGFVPFSAVLDFINQHFSSSIEVRYEYCGDNGKCELHDAHLLWWRL